MTVNVIAKQLDYLPYSICIALSISKQMILNSFSSQFRITHINNTEESSLVVGCFFLFFFTFDKLSKSSGDKKLIHN